jgi:hypothetical protein
MTDIIVKIVVELLSVLGLATMQIQQGRLSECCVICIIARGLMCCREIR